MTKNEVAPDSRPFSRERDEVLRYRQDPGLTPPHVERNRRLAVACIWIGGCLQLVVIPAGMARVMPGAVAQVFQALRDDSFAFYAAIIFGVASLTFVRQFVGTLRGPGVALVIAIFWAQYFLTSPLRSPSAKPDYWFWELFWHLDRPESWLSLAVCSVLPALYTVPLLVRGREDREMRAAQQADAAGERRSP
jgi:hypothetical protein